MTRPSWLNIHTELETIRDDGVATIRTSLVRICDGNFCAAIILDDFYFQCYCRIASADPCINPSPSLLCRTTIPDLIFEMSDIFDRETVIDALGLIASKGYASIWISQDHYVAYEVSFDAVHLALGVGSGESQQSYAPPVEHIHPQSQQSSIPQKPQRSKRKESKVVKFHNQRASSVALPATLTLEQWKQTLDDFNNKCAYCLTGDYEVLEHFIPLTSGGGTTEYNCVPSCASCNSSKSDNHPSMIPASNVLFGALERVRRYLELRKGADS